MGMRVFLKMSWYPAALAAQGIDSVSEAGFYLDVAVGKGAQLRIDDDSTLMRKNALKEITSEITTYQYGTNLSLIHI